jgi:putative transposase
MSESAKRSPSSVQEKNDALPSLAFAIFEAIFKEFDLPKAIRTDNGVPSASPNSLFSLSKLSVWRDRLGIEIERIKPGHP